MGSVVGVLKAPGRDWPARAVLCPVAAACTVFLSPIAVAQEATGSARSGVSIVPRISVSETYTTNVFLSNTRKQSDLITQVSPGIRMSSTGGRFKGSIDYSLNELVYANSSTRRQSQNALNAAGTVEAIDNWAFIDFSGQIGQQAISAFGAPVGDGTAVNGNSTETAVFKISPYLRGRLGSAAEYEARYSLTSSRSDAAAVSNVNARDLSLNLSGNGARRGMGWYVALVDQSIDYSAGRSNNSRRINGQFNYPFTDRWGGYLKIGRESSDFLAATSQSQDLSALGVTFTPNDEAQFSIDKGSQGSTGLTVKWAPSKRTSVSVLREHRLFGDTQNIALAYRTANTAWTFSDNRGVVSTTGLSSVSTPTSLYDLLLTQFSAIETDPVKREQFAAELQANGIKPAATAVGGFLTNALSRQNQQQVSFALFGARSTISLTATRGSNSRLDSASTAIDDLSTSSVVRQNGLIANISYRLTANSTLSLIAASQNASGSAGQTGTSTKTFNVNLSTRLTKDATAGLGLRRVIFDSSTAPYTETAVLGNVNVQF